jgi:hypothetical protein
VTNHESTPSVPYDKFFGLSALACQRYGSIFSLPVAEQPYTFLLEQFRSHYRGGRVLDFGCGAQKTLQKVLDVDDLSFHSCDNDPSGAFTFHDLSEIPTINLYEIISANQVFEHLSFEEGIRTAVALAGHVAPGGILQIGVPNPQHPTRQMGNPTHVTPWSYHNLCALLELGGLDPYYCVRCNKTPVPRWYERPLVAIMCRVFRMDWCDTVYAVGKRIVRNG